MSGKCNFFLGSVKSKICEVRFFFHEGIVTDPLALMRVRLAEAIGGRRKALSFEAATNRRFKRHTLQHWIDGDTCPSLSELMAFAEEVGRPIEWFLGLEKPEPVYLERPESVVVPILNVEAAAGDGRIADVVRAEAEFDFPLHFLRKLIGDRTRSARLSSLRARGESMEPTIADGALLIIDESDRDLPVPQRVRGRSHRAPDIFVFITTDGVRLKRLQRRPDGFITIISDNVARHPPELYKPGPDGAFQIIGKVIWWDNRL